MKIYFNLFIFCSAVFFFCQSCGQEKKDSVRKDSVKAVVLPDSVHYSIPFELKIDTMPYYENSDPYPIFALGRFYPIGWSKDGFFAYAQMMADTVTGSKNQRLEVQIRNMKNDSIVWLITEMIPHSPYVDDGDIRTQISPIDSLWKKRYTQIVAELWKYRIIQVKSAEQKFFTQYLKDDLSLRDSVILVDEMHNKLGYTFCSNTKLWLISGWKKKEKLFYNKDFTRGPMWFETNGYLQDPYSNRGVVIIDLYFHGKNDALNLVTHDVAMVDPTVF